MVEVLVKMPQIPYKPYSEVTAEATPTPAVHVQAPIQAFGGAVAEAVKHLGTTAQHVGDELFQRAYALQQLENETAARKADFEAMKEMAPLHAEFNARQGKDAVDAAPEHYKKIEEIWARHRSNLPNDQARKQYDAFALG